jgi:hypothetical protein
VLISRYHKRRCPFEGVGRFWWRRESRRDRFHPPSKNKHKVPPAYSRADDGACSLNGPRDDESEQDRANTKTALAVESLEKNRRKEQQSTSQTNLPGDKNAPVESLL